LSQLKTAERILLFAKVWLKQKGTKLIIMLKNLSVLAVLAVVVFVLTLGEQVRGEVVGTAGRGLVGVRTKALRRSLTKDDDTDDDDDDDDDDEGCNDECSACLTEEECVASDEGDCTFENGACREMTDSEEYNLIVQLCEVLGPANCYLNPKECRVVESSVLLATCVPRKKAPKTCEVYCEKCKTEDTCAASPGEGGCSWQLEDDDDDEEYECKPINGDCNDECSDCLDEDACNASLEGCKFENGVCREMDDDEEFEHVMGLCSDAGVSGCKSLKKNCKFDKKSSSCLTKMKAPDTCQFECEKCTDESSCSASLDSDGCAWHNNECMELDDIAEACDEDCSQCLASDTCLASKEQCKYESGVCSEMTDEEKYSDALTICSAASDKGACKSNKECKWKNGCSPKAKQPKSCAFDCEECAENECSGQGSCLWDASEAECIDADEACDESCGLCGDETACSESKEGCVFDSSVCREMTALEKWQADDAACSAIGDDKRGCKSLKKTCKYKDGSCQVKKSSP